eukprot:scaffold288_cov143-Ochromonas_danica.AAC.2
MKELFIISEQYGQPMMGPLKDVKRNDLPKDEKKKLLRYAKLVERQRKKEEKTAKEKERVAKLTPNELRLEMERKKEEVKDRKREKQKSLLKLSKRSSKWRK